MNFLVFLDTEAGELEKILSGVKTMLLKETSLELSEDPLVQRGDSLFFLRSDGECSARVMATVVFTQPVEAGPDDDLSLSLKELQPGLQLTEDQYNFWSGHKQALIVGFEAAQKVPELHVPTSMIASQNTWIAFEEICELVQEGEKDEPGSNFKD